VEAGQVEPAASVDKDIQVEMVVEIRLECMPLGLVVVA
jgi:hypothetical protein